MLGSSLAVRTCQEPEQEKIRDYETIESPSNNRVTLTCLVLVVPEALGAGESEECTIQVKNSRDNIPAWGPGFVQVDEHIIDDAWCVLTR